MKRKYLLPWAPVRTCHNCGKSSAVVQFKVDEAVSELVLLTPYNRTGHWVREVSKLRKPSEGWDFSDPTRYPLARDDAVYGDRKTFERRREQLLEKHREQERLKAGRENSPSLFRRLRAAVGIEI
jgi:hypothetical protein